MRTNRIKVGDHVRIVNYLRTSMPVGIVERMDGTYIYVTVDVDGREHQYRGKYEVYENELVKITEQEYFKLILAGANKNV